MMIRNRLYMTLKGSPLNSRGYAVPPGNQACVTTPLKGSPMLLLGHSFRVLFSPFPLSAGPSDTAAIERRRFQRLCGSARKQKQALRENKTLALCENEQGGLEEFENIR